MYYRSAGGKLFRGPRANPSSQKVSYQMFDWLKVSYTGLSRILFCGTKTPAHRPMNFVMEKLQNMVEERTNAAEHMIPLVSALNMYESCDPSLPHPHISKSAQMAPIKYISERLKANG